MPSYKWDSPASWLLDRINDADVVDLRGIARELTELVDNDSIQNVFQSDMSADGYFDDLDKASDEDEDED